MSNSLPDLKTLELCANTVRILSAEAVEKANSGHPGMPMGAADYAAVLWLKYLSFNPRDPRWLNRDRFVLSNGHGSMLLYSMLYLSGYDLTLDDLKSFRQWESKTPGHPESFMTPGVECTTGPLGQGISNAVGMAIAELTMAARYNRPDFSPFAHNVFCFAGDGCLMEGVSSEASSVAGHLGLSNLIVLYDDNKISIAGSTELAFTEDVLKRYEAYGWYVQRIDGHNYTEIDRAIDNAVKESDRPSIIAARTIIGKGSPHKAGDAEVHGAPLGKEELLQTKQNLNWPTDSEFFVPDEVRKTFAARVEALTERYAAWQDGFGAWRRSNPELAEALDRQVSLSVPADLEKKLLDAVPKDGKAASTRKLSSEVLQAASKAMNCVIGGSADLEPSTFTLIKGSEDVEKGRFGGLNLRFGVREHAMGALMNGMSYYGGFIPYGSTFLVFSDYMRPPIRLAALAHIPGLFIFTHDSIFLGEDGPTHQPIEHLAALRAIPNVRVFRPADGVETALCYAMALEQREGPSVLALSRQNLEPIARRENFDTGEIRRGGYSVYESGSGAPNIVFVATGSEVSLAIQAAKTLGDVGGVRVVSIPCVEIFSAQPAEYRNSLIPKSAIKVVCEAATPMGWSDALRCSPEDIVYVTMHTFGASAPMKALQEKFGFTPSAVAETVRTAVAAGRK